MWTGPSKSRIIWDPLKAEQKPEASKRPILQRLSFQVFRVTKLIVQNDCRPSRIEVLI